MMLHSQRDVDIYIYIYILSHYNVDPYIPSFNFLFLLTFYCEVVRNSIVIVIFLKQKNIYSFINQILQLKKKKTLPRGRIDAEFFFMAMALHIKVVTQLVYSKVMT